MLDNLRKSLSAALYERTASPLYGTFIVSWCLWNWQILYLLFWEDQALEFKPKMDMVVCYADWWRLTVVPIISTAILLTGGNWLANKAYFLQLKFDKSRRKEKETSDEDKRLTIEESIAIRKEIYQQRESSYNEVKRKELDIDILNKQLEKVIAENTSLKEKEGEISISKSNLLRDLDFNVQDTPVHPNILHFEKIMKQLSSVYNWEELFIDLRRIIRDGEKIYSSENAINHPNFIPLEMIDILDANSIIHKNQQGKNEFTEFGQAFVKYYTDKRYENAEQEKENKQLNNVYKKIANYNDYKDQMYALQWYVQQGEKVNSNGDLGGINADLIGLLESNHIIENIRGVGVYGFTDIGKKFLQLYHSKLNTK